MSQELPLLIEVAVSLEVQPPFLYRLGTPSFTIIYLGCGENHLLLFVGRGWQHLPSLEGTIIFINGGVPTSRASFFFN